MAEQRERDSAAWKAAPAGQATPIAPDDDVIVDLRVLSGAEESTVLHNARRYAIERGLENPKDGDPLYELAKMAETLALGVIDHDSPETAPSVFFDGGAKQILDEVDGDRIAFLHARWESWQQECSPQLANLKADDLYEHVVRITLSDDDADFLVMRPGLARLCMRFMGAVLLSSHADKSALVSAFSAAIGANSGRGTIDKSTSSLKH